MKSMAYVLSWRSGNKMALLFVTFLEEFNEYMLPLWRLMTGINAAEVFVSTRLSRFLARNT